MPLTIEDLGHHISGQFNEDLNRLLAHVLEMGQLVEQQIRDAVHALLSANVELAAAVIRRGSDANSREVHLDEECSLILVRRQPAAGDLRVIFAVIKSVTDFERIGDQAERIARSAIEHAADTTRRNVPSVRRLTELATTLLRRALDAFARMDADAAREVRRMDPELDREYETLMHELVTLMTEDPRAISWSLNMAWAARALERVGDHAKNLAEYVIYMVEGEDVRHSDIVATTPPTGE